MNKTNRNILLISLILLLAWLFFCFYCGERIRRNNGLGWDGVFYAQVAINPLDYITNIGVNNYQFARLLPSVLVHYLSKLAGYQLGTSIMIPEPVVNAFTVYNSGLIVCGIIVLYLIAKHLKWEPSVFTISIASLFINFPILKLSTYNPTLTDISAFTLSLLIFYFYLKKQQIMLFLISLLAAFSWPTMIYTSVPLLIFSAQDYRQEKFEPSKLSNVFSAVIAALLSVGVLYDYYVNKLRFPDESGASQVNEKVIVLSVLLLFFFIWWMLYHLSDWRYFIANLTGSLSFRGIFLAAILLLGIKLTINMFAKGSYFLTPALQIRYIGQSFIVNPLISIVAHVSYFGPVVILTLLFWKNIVSGAKQYGKGLMAIIILGAILSIGTESRQLMAIWPIFAILTCDTLNKQGVTWSMACSIVCVSLVTSRFWLNINGTQNWEGPYTEFPYQMLFMNFGPWLSNSMYLFFALVTCILFLWLFLSKKYYAQFNTKRTTI